MQHDNSGSCFSHSCAPNTQTVPMAAGGRYTICIFAMQILHVPADPGDVLIVKACCGGSRWCAVLIAAAARALYAVCDSGVLEQFVTLKMLWADSFVLPTLLWYSKVEDATNHNDVSPPKIPVFMDAFILIFSFG